MSRTRGLCAYFALALFFSHFKLKSRKFFSEIGFFLPTHPWLLWLLHSRFPRANKSKWIFSNKNRVLCTKLKFFSLLYYLISWKSTSLKISPMCVCCRVGRIYANVFFDLGMFSAKCRQLLSGADDSFMQLNQTTFEQILTHLSELKQHLRSN